MQGRKEEKACMQVIFKLHNNSDNVCGEKKVSGVQVEIRHCFLFLKKFFLGKKEKFQAEKSVSLVDIMT